MYTSQIEKDVNLVIQNFNKESFIYDLLLAYGISKTSITRLKNGDFNLSKIKGEILYKKKVLFKEVESQQILTTIDSITKNEEALKHNPRFVIVTDYQTLLAKDIRTGLTLDTPILELYKHYDFFLPWAGQEKQHHKNDNHADRKASYEMAKLYDILVHDNPKIYSDGGHNLNIFLSRILFCFFAEDTDIFSIEGVFTDTLAQHTKNDGSDVHLFLDRLFLRLRTHEDKDIPKFLLVFPYVNGGLFKDSIHSPQFSSKARKILIDCGALDWSEINPDIFGSMIQAVVNPEYRSGLGMHYTSVPNIMKVIDPLFLDNLKDEFEKSKESSIKLRRLIHRITKIKIFDPACGSGNFLIISYKELRRLEIKIFQQLNEIEPQQSIVFTEIRLSQFYGIELDDFAHEMAILSLWLAEHQMNKEFVEELRDFGKAKPILPLKEAGNIIQGNATTIDWQTVCPQQQHDEIYLLGNPPYLGSRKQKKKQKEELDLVFKGFRKYKDLDYISIWFFKGANYIKGTNSKLAFVSTNSICQGEQVSLLWPNVFSQGLKISFAHLSFKWRNNAKDVAGVTVVILGLSNLDTENAVLFYDNYKISCDNINAYLIPGKNETYVYSRTKPLSDFPKMNHGNMPADGGKFLFTDEEKIEFEKKEPLSHKWFKQLLSAREYLNGRLRWCLWLEGITTEGIESMPMVKRLVEEVREIRLKSSRPQLANVPHLFAQITQPEDVDCVIVPRVSSERRKYLPTGFIDGSIFKVTDSLFAIATKEPYIFGVISSRMHTIWLQAIGGKMKTDYQYSKNIVYNTFPFPKIDKKQKENLSLHVMAVLEERENYPEKTLAQLYDPNKMPKALKDVHTNLDSAIERCYRLKPFENDVERLEYLFKQYELMTSKKN